MDEVRLEIKVFFWSIDTKFVFINIYRKIINPGFVAKSLFKLSEFNIIVEKSINQWVNKHFFFNVLNFNNYFPTVPTKFEFNKIFFRKNTVLSRYGSEKFRLKEFL